MLVGDAEEGAILYSSPSASENSSRNFFEQETGEEGKYAFGTATNKRKRREISEIS